jgi:hypothetical protein
MATRYWVGGNGIWGTGGTTANWSASSGGASGASIPGLNDDVILDAASGSATITVAGTAQPRSIVATTFIGTFTGTGNIQLLGSNTGLQGSGISIALGPPGVGGMTYSYTGLWTIGANTGSGSINFNGQSHSGNNININGSSANSATAQYSLVNNITNTTNAITVGGCTFNTNNYNITCPRFDIVGGANTKVLNFGTSVITLTITNGTFWNNANTGSLTITGTYTIRYNAIATSTISFLGGGATYYNVELLRGSSTAQLTVTGNNTFYSFTDATSTAAHTISFATGSTQTFENFNVRGSSGLTRILLAGSAGATVFFVKTGAGAVTVDYLNLSTNITSVSPAATWYAGYNSIGSGTGWILRNPTGMLLMGVGG